jgi:hypothetical protein
MDALALFVPFLMITAAHEAALAQYRYASAAQYEPAYVYTVPPGSGWAPGAALGASVGALASGHPGPAVAGALIGGSIGYSATLPPVYATPAAYTPPSPPPSARARSASADAFIANWMNFMQPR